MSSKEAILRAKYRDAQRKGDHVLMMLVLREIVALSKAGYRV
jgi:hypothetical protein